MDNFFFKIQSTKFTQEEVDSEESWIYENILAPGDTGIIVHILQMRKLRFSEIKSTQCSRSRS